MNCFRFSIGTGSAALFFVLFLLLTGANAASAQTRHASSLKVKQETKKGIRQARKVKAEYKDTHLNTEIHAFKKGQPGHRQFTPRDGYDFDESGYPIIENKRKKKGLFRRKKP